MCPNIIMCPNIQYWSNFRKQWIQTAHVALFIKRHFLLWCDVTGGAKVRMCCTAFFRVPPLVCSPVK